MLWIYAEYIFEGFERKKIRNTLYGFKWGWDSFLNRMDNLLILFRIALVFEWTRIMVSLTKIKLFLEKKQLQSNEAEIPFFEQLRSLKEWWRHDDESYLWLIKMKLRTNDNLNDSWNGKDLTWWHKREILVLKFCDFFFENSGMATVSLRVIINPKTKIPNLHSHSNWRPQENHSCYF